MIRQVFTRIQKTVNFQFSSIYFQFQIPRVLKIVVNFGKIATNELFSLCVISNNGFY